DPHFSISFPTRRSSDLGRQPIVRLLPYLFCAQLGTSYGRGASAPQPNAPNTPDFRHSALGQPIRRDRRGNTFLGGDLEDPQRRRSEEHTSELQSRENLV